MYERILSPIDIGGVKVPNRVVRTAHATGIGAGQLNEALIEYHAARARGGVGLTIVEILSVHPTSPASLNAFDPSLPRGYEQLMAACSPHGMKVFQQIWHAGHNATPWTALRWACAWRLMKRRAASSRRTTSPWFTRCGRRRTCDESWSRIRARGPQIGTNPRTLPRDLAAATCRQAETLNPSVPLG